MVNISQGIVLILPTHRDAQFISASLVVERTHCFAMKAPQHPAGTFPASCRLLITLLSPSLHWCSWAPQLKICHCPTMDLFWLTSSSGGRPGQGFPLLISNEVCIARGLSQPVPYGCLHPWTSFCCSSGWPDSYSPCFSVGLLPKGNFPGWESSHCSSSACFGAH